MYGDGIWLVLMAIAIVLWLIFSVYIGIGNYLNNGYENHELAKKEATANTDDTYQNDCIFIDPII